MNKNLNDKKNNLRSKFSTPLLPWAIESFSPPKKKNLLLGNIHLWKSDTQFFFSS
jgi:hypothetical protein